MKRVTIHTLPLLALGTLSLSCGKAKPMPVFDTGAVQNMALPADGSNIMGRYKGEFITLNTGVNGFLTTQAFIIRKENKFYVSLKLTGGAPNTWHKQDIYNGWRCPTDQDDLNKDGFIDIEEGKKVWGDPVISLDGDLKGQEAGKNVYPVSNSKGTYTYKRSADFDVFFKDLNLPQGLPLEGNVMVVLGADESSNLPDTVATLEGLDRHKSLPLACALITKVNTNDPGNIEDDEGNLGNPEAPGPAHTDHSRETTETVRVSTPERPEHDDHDEEGWDDRIRRWWRRTIGRGDDD